MPRLASALLLFSCLRAGASDLPAGLPAVTLGMTQEALLAARPEIRRKNYSGVTIPASRPHNAWNEHLTAEAWPYRFALFEVKGGVLVRIILNGDPAPDELRAARLQAIAAARALWGDDYTSELETASGVLAPVAVWSKPDRGVRLFIPPATDKKHSGARTISLDVRLASERRASQTEVVLSSEKRSQLFEECGLEDRRPTGPAGPDFDELGAAPLSVVLNGREVALAFYARRDFAKYPAQDGEPMTVDFTARALDGKPFPAGVRIDGGWVWQGRELWRIPSLAAAGQNGGSPELRASAAGGPRWGGSMAQGVVRLIDRDGRAVLLGAPGRNVAFGNFR